jgi:hypothetical protein
MAAVNEDNINTERKTEATGIMQRHSALHLTAGAEMPTAPTANW